jgi:hypothetical protein
MNRNSKKVPSRFAPETRFEVILVPPAPFRGSMENKLEALKHRLLAKVLNEIKDIDLNVLIRRVANEASALAWTTPFPLLMLPSLLDEKVQSARRQAERQKAVLKRSHRLLGAVK